MYENALAKIETGKKKRFLDFIKCCRGFDYASKSSNGF